VQAYDNRRLHRSPCASIGWVATGTAPPPARHAAHLVAYDSAHYTAERRLLPGALARAADTAARGVRRPAGCWMELQRCCRHTRVGVAPRGGRAPARAAAAVRQPESPERRLRSRRASQAPRLRTPPSFTAL
jgi:hypothetical protein